MNSKIHVFILCLVCVGMQACDFAASLSGPETDYQFRQFGERCERHVECESTYCLDDDMGAFCSKPCDEGCPEDWTCEETPNPHGEGSIALCAKPRSLLCMACSNDEFCGLNGSNLCVSLDDGQFCAQDCTYASCPEGYSCENVPRANGELARQCIPVLNACSCSAANEGQVRGCFVENEFGSCPGYETCSNKKWGVCDAKTPAAETCNGVDDDCNGFVDEETDGEDCFVTNEFGACPGKTLCGGEAGLICTGQVPMAELCNGLDDDCDGLVDEDFKTDELYLQKENCGACGNHCDLVLQHSTSTECIASNGFAQCRAKACEPGFFVYLDGAVCMALPDNLCSMCSQDSDCIGPNSKCIVTPTESFCGRDCSAESAYGPSCPAGFSCRDVQGAKQCYPDSNTCMCNVENVGSARSCHVDTCVGFEWCASQASGFEWTSCKIDAYNFEVCDGMDNNCDGQIDEGMLNPVTGLYDSIQHCGYCFNDCTDYYKPEIHHVNGVCIVQDGAASCGMGACLTENEGGQAYEWVNADKDVENGCECRRIAGNLTQDEPNIVEEYGPGGNFVDENCDGIDGVKANAIFVRKTAEDGGDGSFDKPFNTIGAAVKAWGKSGASYILVTEGTYEEDLNLPDGLVMHGGYSVNFSSRDLVRYASVIQGVGAGATVRVVNAKQMLVEGFVIRGADRSSEQTGAASIAVWLQNCGSDVQFVSNNIEAGTGASGVSGAAGSAGHGRTNDARLDGQAGLDSLREEGPCVNARQAGGAAGSNASCPSANATAGGSVVCPKFDMGSYKGGQAEYSSTTLNRGLGGYDESFDDKSGLDCTHATETGFPTSILTNNGQDGMRGESGKGGFGGAGGSALYGSFKNGTWVAVNDSQAGATGEPGEAGGGGGASGGVAYYHYYSVDCPLYELGATGGGGGAGGCGGSGGGAGTSGGASFALVLTSTYAYGARPTLKGNVLTRGQGGVGGSGGIGGEGGIGGLGGEGGIGGYWISVKAGRGGAGGQGGRGGGGGGGAGGPSFDIFSYNISVNSLLSVNTFTLAAEVATGGAGGAGGIGSDIGQGSQGVQGASGTILSFSLCNAGKCAAGYACNADNICLPK